MAGWYELGKSSDGQFRFTLKAGNGEPILASERYKSKQSAEGGIASCQVNSPIDARYVRLTAQNGQHYFVLKAGNGEPIGTSETYKTAQGREDGIASVKINGPTTIIKDLT